MASWEGIREFVAVVEVESFTKASKRLEISTAQVSRQVGALEERLSTKLFYRTTRRVTVTEAGQLFYNYCRPLLEGLEEAEAALNTLQNIPRGKLKVTAPVNFGERYIAPVVSVYCCEFPDLEVELLLTNQKVDLVENGFDLAIRLGELEDSNMMAKKLGVRTLHLCASPEYLKAHGRPESLAELKQHNCLLGTLDYWRFGGENLHEKIRVKGSLRCNSGIALLNAALSGAGLVQLPNYYVSSELQSAALIELLPELQPEEEGIWALYPHNRNLSSKVSFLIERITRELAWDV